MWRLRPDVLRAAWWALWAVRAVRRQLAAGLRDIRVGPPPRLPRTAGRGVDAALFRLSPTCLEGAYVRQAWLAAHGHPRDIVIGVEPEGLSSGPAHAWVEGHDLVSPQRYVELHRLPARPCA